MIVPHKWEDSPVCGVIVCALHKSDNCFRVLAVKCSAKLADVNHCRRQKEKVEHGLHHTEAYIRTSVFLALVHNRYSRA